MLRSRRYSALLALLVVLIAQERPAQAQGDSLRLSRAAAQERALAHSTELARRGAARMEARQLGRVSYPYNPELSVEIEGVPSPWSSAEYTRRIVVEQEIDLRGERRARSRLGNATASLTDRELDARAQEIAAEVDQAYSRHLVAGRKAALLEPLRHRARNLRSKAESARRRETLTGFDARLLRSEALSLEADWLDVRRELDIAGAELRTWLALPSDSAFALEDDLDDRSWSCDIDSALVLARQTRWVLARAAAAESVALARLTLEQRLARVNPTLGASVGRERLQLEPDGFGAINDEDTFVGLHVRLPLPLFQRNSTAVAEARLELQRAGAERVALDREVQQEVSAACAGLRRVEEERKLRAEAAESAGRDLRLIETAYEDGRIPLDEYLTLRERLVRQQIGLLDALGALEEDRARLVRATGVSRAELAQRWGGER